MWCSVCVVQLCITSQQKGCGFESASLLEPLMCICSPCLQWFPLCHPSPKSCKLDKLANLHGLQARVWMTVRLYVSPAIDSVYLTSYPKLAGIGSSFVCCAIQSQWEAYWLTRTTSKGSPPLICMSKQSLNKCLNKSMNIFANK